MQSSKVIGGVLPMNRASNELCFQGNVWKGIGYSSDRLSTGTWCCTSPCVSLSSKFNIKQEPGSLLHIPTKHFDKEMTSMWHYFEDCMYTMHHKRRSHEDFNSLSVAYFSIQILIQILIPMHLERWVESGFIQILHDRK